ncbi:pseudouridine synthase [Dokdonella sp.]|uniref:pseudouridine synthase n=1 Tax=Dokdonella sp. TaxID=2291710 RepID=UPI00378437AB
MTTSSRSILKLKRTPDAADAPAVEERLHKVLANAGLGSRRMLETRIEAGEVQLNGAVATLGQSVRSGDRVEMDGKRFVVIADNAEHAQVLLYNKPDGVVATRDDPEGRETVFEQLPQIKGARWIAVGRLDINTTGLLLLTTDGDLANTLMHPRSEIEREYICRVHGEVPDEVIEKLRNGIELEDGPAHFEEIAVISRGASHSWFRVVLREGRNREVRRMWESQGLMVSRLKRIRYGSVELPRGLLRGQSTELDASEVASLRERVGVRTPEPRLTLAPVIGQRRAVPTEFRPNPKAQQAWTGTQGDEAREFAAFDRIRDDGWRGAAAKPRKARGPGGPGGARGPGGRKNGPPQQRAGRGGPGGQARGQGPRQGQGQRGPRQGQGQGHGQAQGHSRAHYAEPGLSPAVLKSWFPDAAGQPGSKRRGARPGMEQPYNSGQFQPHGNKDDNRGNRVHPQNPQPSGRGPRRDGNQPNANPNRRGGSPGNSVQEGSPYGNHAPRPQHAKGPRPNDGRRPPNRGGSPGNSVHDTPSGNRAPGGRNRGRGPRPR